MPNLFPQPPDQAVASLPDRLTYEQLQQRNQDLEAAVAAGNWAAQLAQAEAARQRQRLEGFFDQAPAAICILDGPDLVYELVNPAYQQLFPDRPLLGLPLLVALPELAGQPVWDTLKQVYRTGLTHVDHNVGISLARTDDGPLETIYFTYLFQARTNLGGRPDGVLVCAFEVTAQVRASQQVQLLNEQLAAANAELSAHNAALTRSQLQLQWLNNSLDSHVAERTEDLQIARADTERQRAGLERLFMAAPAAICILAGPELIFELVNPGYQQLFPGRALRGLPLLVAVPEVAEIGSYQMLRRVYDTGLSVAQWGELVPLAGADGRLEDRYFDLIYQARYDENGTIDGMLVFAYEVTAQVVARRASEAGAHRLQLITDALPVLIGYLDRDEKYRFTNRTYKDWFLQDPADLLGQTMQAVVGEAAYAVVQERIARALAGERLDFVARMPYRPDFVRDVHISYVPDYHNGAVAGFYSMVADVTEEVEARRVAEASAQQALTQTTALAAANLELLLINDDLSRINVDLDTFVYMASHDLKEPIFNIEGLLHTLLEDLPPAVNTGPVAQVLGLMQGAIDRFEHTIGLLTDIARIQQEHGLELPPVELAAVVNSVALDLAPLLDETKGTLTVALTGCPAPRFTEKNLRSVVFNLLSNALKYRHPARPPAVCIGCRTEEGYHILTVQDNGLGLDLSPDRPLFTLFRRYHPHIEGSGVGLYMVRKMVENAGGRIEVASKLGVGSTFSVYFRE